jgi:hypothetical protein
MWIMGCLIGHHEMMARAIEMKLCSMMKAVSHGDGLLAQPVACCILL